MTQIALASRRKRIVPMLKKVEAYMELVVYGPGAYNPRWYQAHPEDRPPSLTILGRKQRKLRVGKTKPKIIRLVVD